VASRATGPALDVARARRILGRMPTVLEQLTADFSAADWRAQPSPGRWSPLEILCHLRDEEAEDFGARLRVVLAGGGVFAPIRPVEWVTERGYRAADPKQALDEFRRRRQSTLDLLSDVTAEQLAVAGRSADGSFQLTGFDVIAAWVAHDLLHLRQFTGTAARLWGNTHPDLRVDYAGELPYPPAPRGTSSQG
jgi:hypothetical protein